MSRFTLRPSFRFRVGPAFALALLLGSTGSYAQLNFVEHALTDHEEGGGSVHAADVDGDGDTDVVASLSGLSPIGVVWFDNNGGSPPVFTERLISDSFSSPSSVRATDMDGDGDTDVLIAWHGSGVITWHENVGGSPPAFMERIVSPDADSPGWVFPADLDGDGDTDVLSAQGGVVWYESDGGTPPTFSQHNLSHEAGGLVFATDLDGDGDFDVLTRGSEDIIFWFENDGGSPPQFTERIVAQPAPSTSFYPTDLDGDGDTDVVATAKGTGVGSGVVWYENDGGTPPAFTGRGIAASGSSDVFAEDLDGDGDIDVLVSGCCSEEFPWYENDGNSPPEFTKRVISDGIDAVALFATDLDGDEDTDVLLANSVSQPVVSVVWLENHGVDIPCVDVDSLMARCDSSATLQVRVTMTDTSHDGESVTIGIDGTPHVRPIMGAVASYRELDAGFGPHTVSLEEPAGCVAPIVTECVALPVGGAVTGMGGDLVVCINDTTGQSVQFSDATSWDCEAAGLVVNPGDHIRQMVAGDAD